MNKKRSYRDYLSYIENVSERYENSTFTEDVQENIEEFEEEEKPKLKRKQTISSEPKNNSIKIVEDRIRIKLDNIGLNNNTINEVVNYVFYDLTDLPSVPTPNKVVTESNQNQNLTSIKGRAEAILNDETFSQPLIPEQTIVYDNDNTKLNEEIQNLNIGNYNLNDAAERASALLL